LTYLTVNERSFVPQDDGGCEALKPKQGRHPELAKDLSFEVETRPVTLPFAVMGIHSPQGGT
jgi:hypothetical protein